MFGNRNEVLREEIALLEEEGVIDGKLAKKLLSRYEGRGDGAAGRFVPFVTGTGAVLVGLGFILYIAANWGYISDLAKTILLIVSVAATAAAGYILSEEKGMKKTGAAFLIMSSLIYGASIFLIGQIYNLGGTLTDAFLLWAIGVLPMAYYAGYRLLLIIAWTLVVATLFAYLEEHFIRYTWYSLFVGVGTVVLGLSPLHRQRYSGFANDLVRIGTFLLLGASYVLTFQLKEHSYFLWADSDNLTAAIVPSVIAAVFVLGLRFRRTITTIECGTLVAHLAIISSIAYLQMGRYYDKVIVSDWTVADVTDVAYSIYYFLLLLFVSYAGVKRNSRELVNGAIGFLALFILTKFFDAFSSLMDRGLFFIFGGVILVAVGYAMERVRKRLLERISH